MGDFYEGRIFRPPSEASSLIIQSTIGCSHNKCAFCEMYKEKRFRIRSVGEVIADLTLARTAVKDVRRVFFADGDAFVRSTGSHMEIMEYLRGAYPECERVSMYASPRSIALKTDDELALLCASGIKLLYIGLESGDDAVLTRIHKGASADEIVTSVIRARGAGFKTSVTAISGLAGLEGSLSHARKTAGAASRMKSDYFSLLSLMLEPGSDMYEDFRAGRFVPMKASDILYEARELISGLDSEGTVFRSNHASNYVELRGTLNGDRHNMLRELDEVISGFGFIKPERYRGL